MANVIQGRFGGAATVDAPTDPTAAGAPISPGTTARQLELIAHNADVAATRLVQIPRPGDVPKALLDDLLTTYSSIEANIADVLPRAATADGAKDTDELMKQTQALVD